MNKTLNRFCNKYRIFSDTMQGWADYRSDKALKSNTISSAQFIRSQLIYSGPYLNNNNILFNI